MDEPTPKERFQNIVEASPMGMHMYRLEPGDRLVFVGANPAADRILAVDNSQFVGKTIEEAFPPLANTEIPERYRRAAAEGLAWQTSQVMYEHGEISGAFLVHAFQTAPGEMAASFLDITEQRKAEERLRASEERYRNLVETALVGILRTRIEDGRVLAINTAGAQMLGYSSSEDLLADNLAMGELYYPHEREEMLRALEENGQISDFETRWRLADGRQVNVALSARMYPNEGLLEGVAVDVTRRKQAEERLHRDRSMFTTGPVVVFQIVEDDGWKVEYVSPNVAEVLGYSTDDFVTGTVSYAELIHPDDLQRVRNNGLDNRERKLDSYVQEYRVISRDGAERWVFDYTMVVRDPETDEVICYQGYLVDATERIEAQQALRTLAAELEDRVRDRTADLAAANDELESFAYSVSHDLRAPLRAIKGFGRALFEDCGEQLTMEGRDYLGRIQSATNRMGEMIDGMLELARAARVDMSRQCIELSRLALSCLQELQESASDRTVDCRVDEGLRVRGDPRLIRNLIQNLLDNAWKFTGECADPSITVFEVVRDNFEETDHGTLLRTFCVRDNGVGFTMRESSDPFAAFTQFHPPEAFPGSGVGLATVKRIARRHGGTVWAESESGRGTSIFFTLPTG